MQQHQEVVYWYFGQKAASSESDILEFKPKKDLITNGILDRSKLVIFCHCYFFPWYLETVFP